ncbi:hypothetical protein BKA65DRAFT_196693 [Rhexocercosporidium sp. MPI-PUGE-AT-0058]|nr:hypothetical protein BKA65DRAFT_196693 [Rhexocercosporidium sp. MPI-PUGE-AT-0058]
MVQQPPGAPPLQPGGFYPPRENNYSRNERNTLLDTSQERLPLITAVQRPPDKTIESALRDYVAIPNLKRWALIVQTDEPEPRTFTSQTLRPYRDRFFTDQFRQSFMSSALRADGNEAYQSSSYTQDPGGYSEFDSDVRKYSTGSEIGRSHHRKSRSEESEGDGSVNAKRRRKGYTGQFREKSNDDIPVAQSTQKHELIIGDDDQVEAFYYVRFKDMQQSACKVMGKAFVKLVEPKKQTHHPYTKGDGGAPLWWPNTKGENSVRHKEPDHLYKPERIRLLVHILKMIVEPVEKQCPTVQKLKLNVKTLEAVTMEAMSNWFADKEHTENEQKRPFLKEIFKVAKFQERYKNGEIDVTTVIPVRYGDTVGIDDDSEGDNETYTKYEQDDDAANNSIHMPTPPESLVSPPMAQNQQFQPAEEHNMRSMRVGLPLRYPTSSMEQLGYEDQTYRGINQYQPHSPNTVDASRRNYIPSFPSSQQSMFSSGWSPSPVTSAPVSQYYPGPPQASLPPFALLPQPQQTSHTGQTVHPFHDGLARYDTSPALGNQLRTGSLGPPHHQMPNPSAFQDYLSSDSSHFGQHPEMKDEHQQHHLHQQN